MMGAAQAKRLPRKERRHLHLKQIPKEAEFLWFSKKTGFLPVTPLHASPYAGGKAIGVHDSQRVTLLRVNNCSYNQHRVPLILDLCCAYYGVTNDS